MHYFDLHLPNIWVDNRSSLKIVSAWFLLLTRYSLFHSSALKVCQHSVRNNMPKLHYRPKTPPACLREASPERSCTDLTLKGFNNLRKASLHPQYCHASQASQPRLTLLSRYDNNPICALGSGAYCCSFCKRSIAFKELHLIGNSGIVYSHPHFIPNPYDIHETKRPLDNIFYLCCTEKRELCWFGMSWNDDSFIFDTVN